MSERKDEGKKDASKGGGRKGVVCPPCSTTVESRTQSQSGGGFLKGIYQFPGRKQDATAADNDDGKRRSDSSSNGRAVWSVGATLEDALASPSSDKFYSLLDDDDDDDKEGCHQGGSSSDGGGDDHGEEDDDDEDGEAAKARRRAFYEGRRQKLLRSWVTSFMSMTTDKTAAFISPKRSDDERYDDVKRQQGKDIFDIRDRGIRSKALAEYLQPRIIDIAVRQVGVPRQMVNRIIELMMYLIHTFRLQTIPGLEEKEWKRMAYVVLTLISYRIPKVRTLLVAVAESGFQKLDPDLKVFNTEFKVEAFIDSILR